MPKEMTSRERICVALAHREPDRVPIDLGSTGCTGISRIAYDNLKKLLGLDTPTVVFDEIQQLADVEEEVLRRLHVDTRAVRFGAFDRWENKRLTANSFQDEWGVVRAKPEQGFYYDVVRSPLSGEITLDDVRRHKWPDPTDPGLYRGLKTKARAITAAGHACVLHIRGGFITQSQFARGFEDWFTDLLLQPELAGAVMDETLSFAIEATRRSLKEVGEDCDVIMYSDDIGIQNGPMVSPEVYRRIIKPRQARLIATAKVCSGAKVMLHTCGSVVQLLDDLIEIGVDVLNPVQVTAAGMNPALLKQEFGDRISFWGGIDTHRVLPKGSPDDVRREVRLRLAQMAPGGGYVLNSVHNFQADVPPENILAMFDEGLTRGQYPLCQDESERQQGGSVG